MTEAQKKRLLAMRGIIEMIVGAYDDETGKTYTFPELFKAWDGNGVTYKKGEKVAYDGVVYIVLQEHTSQPTWTPPGAPSLFAKALIPDPDVIPEWEQPGSTNPYMKGDKVRHNGKIWESLIDNNVWEPGAVGTESLWAERSA